jgi:5-deoxy-glucuronate isomerase
MSENRGAGTMQETSTRIVRTVFDHANHPESNLVIGEVVNYPGKWSSYPPHHHAQPEIYHYRFYPKQGFGFGMLQDDGVLLKHGDSTLIIHDDVHSQTSAPGYAMWYLWAIRHLEGNPYGPVTFLEEHKWVMEKDAKIWPDNK